MKEQNLRSCLLQPLLAELTALPAQAMEDGKVQAHALAQRGRHGSETDNMLVKEEMECSSH